MEDVLMSVALGLDIVGLVAVVMGHLTVPKDPQLTLARLRIALMNYAMSESTISN